MKNTTNLAVVNGGKQEQQNEGTNNGENNNGDTNSTTVVILRRRRRQNSMTSSKSDDESINFNSGMENENQKATPENSGKPTPIEFDMSSTMTTIIVSYGNFDNSKRYVSEKEVDTQIGINEVGTIADQCLKESKETQYEPQKLNPENLRRVVNSLVTNSNFLQNSCEILESELQKRAILDTF